MDVKARPASVTGELGYLVAGKEKPFNLMYEPEDGRTASNCVYQNVPCKIRDARQLSPVPSLASHGFELAQANSTVLDFYDDAEVSTRYYEEVCKLITRLTGSNKIHIFDHQRRQRESGRPTLGFGRHGDGSKPAAVGRVHNDYTQASGMRRLKMELPQQAEDTRFMILNLWRPILNPAVDTPLAVCDARTMRDEDWIATDIIYPQRQGEIYLATYSKAHQWYYYPCMDVDEVLVFKTFDSRLDQPARMVPHAAFDDPTAPPDAPLRRSIEVRCLVVLD